MRLVGKGKFHLVVTVPLVLEYEDALHRAHLGLARKDIAAVLDYLCAVGEHTQVFFLWRPMLKDPGDDMVLEAAVEGHCQMIVTHNVGDFTAAGKFGLEVLTPRAFLQHLKERK